MKSLHIRDGSDSAPGSQDHGSRRGLQRQLPGSHLSFLFVPTTGLIWGLLLPFPPATNVKAKSNRHLLRSRSRGWLRVMDLLCLPKARTQKAVQHTSDLTDGERIPYFHIKALQVLIRPKVHTTSSSTPVGRASGHNSGRFHCPEKSWAQSKELHRHITAPNQGSSQTGSSHGDFCNI